MTVDLLISARVSQHEYEKMLEVSKCGDSRGVSEIKDFIDRGSQQRQSRGVLRWRSTRTCNSGFEIKQSETLISMTDT